MCLYTLTECVHTEICVGLDRPIGPYVGPTALPGFLSAAATTHNPRVALRPGGLTAIPGLTTSDSQARLLYNIKKPCQQAYNQSTKPHQRSSTVVSYIGLYYTKINQ